MTKKNKFFKKKKRNISEVVCTDSYYKIYLEIKRLKGKLKELNQQKYELFVKVTKTTSSTKDVISASTNSNNKFTNYLIKVEKISKEITEVETSLKELNIKIKAMNCLILSSLEGIPKEVFKLYFLENKNPTEIANIIPCNRKTVYRHLNNFK